MSSSRLFAWVVLAVVLWVGWKASAYVRNPLGGVPAFPTSTGCGDDCKK